MSFFLYDKFYVFKIHYDIVGSTKRMNGWMEGGRVSKKKERKAKTRQSKKGKKEERIEERKERRKEGRKNE